MNPEKTQILTFSERYWPDGGAELATHLILRILKEEGFDVTVITGADTYEELRGVRYVRDSLLAAQSKLHLWWRLIKQRSELSRLIDQSEVVYIPRLCYPVIPQAKSRGKKVVVHLHNYQPIAFCSILYPGHDNGGENNLIYDMKRSFYHEVLGGQNIMRAIASAAATPTNLPVQSWITLADSIVCVSQRQNDILLRNLPELSSKTVLVYNPLPTVSPGPKSRQESTIVYSGGDSYDKGFPTFLDATEKVLRQGFNARFLLTGRFQDSHGLGNIGRANAYTLLGRLEHKDLLRVRSQCIACVVPSMSEEPLPYSVLEAMLSGTIPIASRVGGIPEIVDGTAAEEMLFAPGDSDGLAMNLERLLEMPMEEIQDIGEELTDHIHRKFDAEAIRKAVIRLFSPP